MKLVFLCGSLEPGKDGVGDYTRLLAGAIAKGGNEVSIISINDQFVKRAQQESITEGDVQIRYLRLPTNYSWKVRFTDIATWINNLNPDWISLQYVPFAFHPKGLPFSLSKGLKKIGIEKNWHLMFHELWVGMDDNANLKMKIWKWLQQEIILKTIKRLNPRLVHTQTRIYQEILKQHQIPALFLPLFGNIPVIDSSKPLQPAKRKLQFVVFGTIHPNVPVGTFLKELTSVAEDINEKVEIIFLGRNGGEQTKWVETCQKNSIGVQLLNERSEKDISEILSNADFGLTTNPVLLAQKSGTVAAMQEHGLPVIAIAPAWQVSDIPLNDIHIEGLYLYTPKLLTAAFLLQAHALKAEKNKLFIVAQQFINDLRNSQNPHS